MVIRDGVLIVNRADQSLVSDKEQRHSRCFVDATTLGFDNAILNLIRHTQTVATADGVCFLHQLNRIECLAIDGNRATLNELNLHIFGINLHRFIPESNAHDGFN